MKEEFDTKTQRALDSRSKGAAGDEVVEARVSSAGKAGAVKELKKKK